MGRNSKTWINGTKSVSKEKVDKYVEDFVNHLSSKLGKKGYGTFNSTYETVGKLDEEKQELSVESHDRNLEKFMVEALDCAVVGFWGYVSAKEWERKAPIIPNKS